MKGFVSFHPLDLGFFDDFIAPLAAGRKVDPEPFVRSAIRMRRNGWAARRIALAVEQLATESEPPPPDPTASRWQRLRANMEKIDYKPKESARRAAKALVPELHLDGRPFFIAEVAAERVTVAIETYLEAETDSAALSIARHQLKHMDPEVARDAEPVDIGELSSDPSYRGDLLSALTKIRDLAKAARDGRTWIDGDATPRPAAEALPEELPWRGLAMHARVTPFWIARDVDGLETVCRAAGVRPPDCLSPAWRVFAEACEEFPALKDKLRLELNRPQDVGAFVAPGEIDDLLRFLNDQGSRIIGAATRGGEGAAATALLRKIKECVVYAQRRGFGYLEASGLLPPERGQV